jgi:ubiquinone biosynthesis protein UbiJ
MLAQLSWLEEHANIILTAATSSITLLGTLVAAIRKIITNAVTPHLTAIHARIDEHMLIEERDMVETHDLAKRTAENVYRLVAKVERLDSKFERLEARAVNLGVEVSHLQGLHAGEHGKQHGD